eukprot:6196321-Pleurochrysis_carterae.AAC.1
MYVIPALGYDAYIIVVLATKLLKIDLMTRSIRFAAEISSFCAQGLSLNQGRSRGMWDLTPAAVSSVNQGKDHITKGLVSVVNGAIGGPGRFDS